MAISSVGAIRCAGVKKGIVKNIFENKLVEKGCKAYEKGYKDKTGLVAGITLSSILLKDAVGCFYYVKQSLANKKIPEEKRKFVAALDLVNGVLMIGLQFATFFTLQKPKVQEKIFNAALGKVCDAGKIVGEARQPYVKALGALVSLVGATIVAKRMVVPFISTPLAQWAKDNIINKGDKDSCEAKHLNREIARSTPDLIAFRNSARHHAQR